MPFTPTLSHMLVAGTTLVMLTSCTQFTYPDSNTPPTKQEPVAVDESADQGKNVPSQEESSWILETDRALALIADPQSVVWDARGDAAALSVKGAQPVTWMEFSRQDAPYKGLLLADLSDLATRITSHDVTSSRRVLVLDDPLAGWGEGGRIVWMLRALGHENAHLVMLPASDRAQIIEAVNARSPQPAPAGEVFTITPSSELTATAEEIQIAIDAPDTVFIDTREQREYDGETPYGESRGGHLPGAKHLYFKTLLTEEGALLDRASLLSTLAEQGITLDRRIVAYCTGGIRSAWLVVVLKDLGFERVENYAGSMWEWAAQDAETHPLEK